MAGVKSDLKSIINTLPQLSEAEREALIIALQNLKASDKSTKKAKITELAGMGKEIWQEIDVDKYIRELRDEWDDRKIR